MNNNDKNYFTPQDINKKSICPIPWMHMALEPDGKVIPCCLTSQHESANLGNINETKFEDIWNSPRMKQTRLDMINGKIPEFCKTCTDREPITGDSSRTFHIAEFPHVIDSIPEITKSDGSVTEMKLKYWDFRFSNLCNFKCRSCGPVYSSSWLPDAKKLNWPVEDWQKVVTTDAIDGIDKYKFLEGQIHEVEKIYFAGGEPLLMPEHWYILKLLKDAKRFDTKISYNTNTSKLTYNGENVLDYWSLWQPAKIEVWASLDEIDERAELIRAGTDWPKIERNLRDMVKLDNIIIRPGITTGAWNVFRIPEIVNRFLDLGIIKTDSKLGIKHNNFFLNYLDMPEKYNVRILPNWFKQETIKKLNNFIEIYDKKHNTSIRYRFDHILHELKKPFDLHYARKFVQDTAILDNIRNEDMYSVVPEMNYVREEVEKHDKFIINIKEI
jgi:radical SAM protein with 4Fe4S-binding SPASM domain